MEVEQSPGSCGHIRVFVIQSSVTGMHNSNLMAGQFFSIFFSHVKGVSNKQTSLKEDKFVDVEGQIKSLCGLQLARRRKLCARIPGLTG